MIADDAKPQLVEKYKVYGLPIVITLEMFLAMKLFQGIHLL
jgi:hypothetical protein